MREEAGLALRIEDLRPLGRLESDNEDGEPTFGNIFLADDLDMKTLARLRIADGKGVFVRRGEVARPSARMTPIAAFALGAYADLERARRADEPPSLLASLFGFGGR